jgi:FkbM family methyltransferase
MISWARNQEDVLLQRAFADFKDGFYVDVGAFLPRADSNTYALYLKGWRGIVVEPLAWVYPEFEQAWKNDRPRDSLVKAMAADFTGKKEFWTCNARQMSTGSEQLLKLWTAGGSTVAEPANVPCVRLGDIWPLDEVHVLSLDVEGMESEALSGLNLEECRPWLIIMECVKPGTKELVSNEYWDTSPLAHKYYTIYEDGVNRWFLAREHIDLADKLRYPPSSWDDWMTWRQAELENQLLMKV